MTKPQRLGLFVFRIFSARVFHNDHFVPTKALLREADDIGIEQLFFFLFGFEGLLSLSGFICHRRGLVKLKLLPKAVS